MGRLSGPAGSWRISTIIFLTTIVDRRAVVIGLHCLINLIIGINTSSSTAFTFFTLNESKQ
jgi:hypothetical protein